MIKVNIDGQELHVKFEERIVKDLKKNKYSLSNIIKTLQNSKCLRDSNKTSFTEIQNEFFFSGEKNRNEFIIEVFGLSSKLHEIKLGDYLEK